MKLLTDKDALRRPGEPQFELETWIDCAPFEQLLGLCIEHVADGKALLSVPFTVKLANGGGVMHGGAMTTLADTAVAMAIKSLLPAGTTFATTRLSMEFMAPVTSGRVTARANVTTQGERLFQGACDVYGETGQVYARFQSTFKVARGLSRPADPRKGA